MTPCSLVNAYQCSSRIFVTTYKTWNYWVFGLCPSSGILKNTREHNISEAGSIFVLRWGGRHLLCWFHEKELTSIIGPGVIHHCQNPLESTYKTIYCTWCHNPENHNPLITCLQDSFQQWNLVFYQYGYTWTKHSVKQVKQKHTKVHKLCISNNSLFPPKYFLSIF
jgi:hypothetical protein